MRIIDRLKKIFFLIKSAKFYIMYSTGTEKNHVPDKGLELSLPFFTGDLGVAPALEEVLGRPDEGAVARWADFLRGGSRTGLEFGQV